MVCTCGQVFHGCQVLVLGSLDEAFFASLETLELSGGHGYHRCSAQHAKRRISARTERFADRERPPDGGMNSQSGNLPHLLQQPNNWLLVRRSSR